jgi:diguanylate cyclase (GGDEF)-like protein/PAS domain S-box-containing protein
VRERLTQEQNGRLAASLSYRMIPTMAVVLTLAFVLTVAALWHITFRQDRQSEERSRALVESAIEVRRAGLRRTVLDYAAWGDAYAHLHPVVDRNWAFEEGNFGGTLFSNLGISYVFVVDPGGRTAYALLDGKLSDRTAESVLAGGVDALVAQARRIETDEDTASATLSSDGMPVLAAAAPLSVGDDTTISPIPGPPSVVVFGVVLDEALLSEIGTLYFVPDLRVPRDAADAAATPRLSLQLPDGTACELRWTPPRPGSELFYSTVPWLALGFLAIGMLAGLVLKQSVSAARQIDASAQRLSDSETALRASEERFRDVADAASDWIWETDADRRLVYVSERFDTLAGLRTGETLGRRLDEFLTQDGQDDWWLSRNELPEKLPPIRARYLDAEGASRICRISAKRRTGPDGSFIGLRGTATDLTDEMAAQRRAQFLALHDAATGLPNRVMLSEFAETALGKMAQGGPNLTILYLNLDRFKPVNDALGHAAGDAVIVEIARRLRTSTRETDLVARMGGDEFVIAMTGASLAEVEAICRRLIEAVSETIRVDVGEVHVGLSIGVALAPHDGNEVGELLRRADVALYQAKRDGRGTYRFFDATMNERIVTRQRLDGELRRALAAGEFVLYYQPRFDARTLRLLGVEALLRWNHPERGIVGPTEFVSLAEETGLIVPIGAWVVANACRTIAARPGIGVSVNISPVQFRRQDIVRIVADALSSSGLAPDRLELELTESVLLEDTAKAAQTLSNLKALGVRLSMDDFGTGYSSLGYLRTFPFDCLKIDRGFVAGLAEANEARAIVQAILGLSRALHMRVAAEGVETKQQLDLLRRDGCDEVQGFLLAMPMPVDELDRLIGARAASASADAVPHA